MEELKTALTNLGINVSIDRGSHLDSIEISTEGDAEVARFWFTHDGTFHSVDAYRYGD
jgi:hypothetical protein